MEDVLYGNTGDDLTYGNTGEDLLYGNTGDDTGDGGTGDDLTYGNPDDDDTAGTDHFGEFTNHKGDSQEISNVVFYLQDGDDVVKIKVDGWEGETDLDNVDYQAFLDAEYAGLELLAVSIKAGNNKSGDLGPGEGQLFLLDGDDQPDDPAGSGLGEEILKAKADETVQFSDGLFA